MRSLIIGADGFLGGYLRRHLEADSAEEVFGTSPAEKLVDGDDHTLPMDITKPDSILDALKQVRPDCIYNLAGINSISYSWEHPDHMIDIHVKGTLNLLDAIRESGIDPTILFIGTGEEYGWVGFNELPVRENHPVNPNNVYAVSKAGQNLMAGLYQRTYHMKVIIARSFNEIGPGQSDRFVLPSICRQLVRIERGEQENTLCVGNLNIMRDFTDVRDTVSALHCLAQKGAAGEVYNIGSGKAHTIRDLIALALKYTDVKPSVVISENRMRPIDLPVLEACIDKIQLATGWSPRIPLEQTVADELEYCRATYGGAMTD